MRDTNMDKERQRGQWDRDREKGRDRQTDKLFRVIRQNIDRSKIKSKNVDRDTDRKIS